MEVYTSTAFRSGRGSAGIVIRSGGETVRVIRRAVRGASRLEAAYRAVLHGVWRARGTGARRIRVFTDDPEVVDQLIGRTEVPVELTGVYLQTRAMLNAYRWSRVQFLSRDRNAEAALAAVEALELDPDPSGLEPELSDPLPLWASAKEVLGR